MSGSHHQSQVTLMMTSAQVVETSVTVTDNSPFQDYPHPDDHTTRSTVTPGFKPFTVIFTEPEENNCFSIIAKVMFRATAFSFILLILLISSLKKSRSRAAPF